MPKTPTLLALLAVAPLASAQTNRPTPPATLGLENGTRDFVTAEYTLRLANDAQVAVGLLPKGANGFDFLPSDRLNIRAADGFYHLGDITFRARTVGSNDWVNGSSATKRRPVTPLKADGAVLAAADLTPTLPENSPIKITRRWVRRNGHLALLFEVSNPQKWAVQIGALGIPMPINNIISDRSLEEAHAKCSFADPYIGEDAGYLQVTQLTGTGPTMVVTPVGKTPFEAYHLLNEPMRPNQTFEGSMEWMVHSDAYANNEWKGVTQWNAPTFITLKSGESRTYGVEFAASPSVRKIEATLQKLGRPVAVGIPGYVLPQDQTGKLFLKYGRPVKSIDVSPAGALTWKPNGDGKRGWSGLDVHGVQWGRSRLTVTYGDGTRQTVHYMVMKPEGQAVADLGHFLTTKAYFTDKSDPFGRAPSVITYDREADAQVTQDTRVWIAGLGDEGGSGNWLAAMMKISGQPNAVEVAKVEDFVDGVIWGNLQFSDGPKKYGVRKSVFFYDPKVLPNFPYLPNGNWKTWTSWSKEATDDIGRGYNYPHVVAAYWSLYRVARNHPEMATRHPWSWYLDQAYETVRYMTEVDANGNDVVGYWRLGLMGGDIFLSVLKDLRREGWTEKANLVEARMKLRADRWKTEAYPFGSEMAWDSTGQEEVYAWCKFFGFEDKAQVSLNSILAYMPTVPHWGYNGNARRYWDFLYGGKLSRIERQIHHYGSGLNAIPLLREYRQHPDDLYLLRVGYGGTMGALSNIDQEGFASAAFHSFPSTLKWDAYSGDYGPNFLGHAFNTATYLVNTPNFGWQAFGGTVSTSGDWVRAKVQDSFRQRVYVAPVGLYVTLDAGTFDAVEFNPKTKAVRLVLSAAGNGVSSARLVVEQPARPVGAPSYSAASSYTKDAGAAVIPLSGKATVIELVRSK